MPALTRARGISGKFTGFYPFCFSLARYTSRRESGALCRTSLGFGKVGGLRWDCQARRARNRYHSKLPTLRFRGKIMLGFAVVLAIRRSAWASPISDSSGVSAGVATYRNSVSEADLARNIDRELISYRALARYYVVTGKEDDAKAALAAEAGLKDAIDGR